MKEKIVIKGIIVKEVPYGEADKLLSILTREHGMLIVAAKFSRRPKNNMLFSTSALTYGEFEITGSESTRYYLNSAGIIEPFMKIRNDIVLLTYCAHIFDLVLDAMRDACSADEIFTLVIYALDRLSRPDPDPDLIVHTFELKLLFLLGFTPLLAECSKCRSTCEDIGSSDILFSFTECGIVCSSPKCKGKAGNTMMISQATLDCLRYISVSQIEKVFSYRITPESATELYELASKYICERLERCYTKLRMLEQL